MKAIKIVYVRFQFKQSSRHVYLTFYERIFAYCAYLEKDFFRQVLDLLAVQRFMVKIWNGSFAESYKKSNEIFIFFLKSILWVPIYWIKGHSQSTWTRISGWLETSKKMSITRSYVSKYLHNSKWKFKKWPNNAEIYSKIVQGIECTPTWNYVYMVYESPTPC